MSKFSVQLFRNLPVAGSRTEAVINIQSYSSYSLKDGEPIVVRYKSAPEVTDADRALFGVAYSDEGGTRKIAWVDLNNGELATQFEALQTTLASLVESTDKSVTVTKDGDKFNLGVNVDGTTITKNATTGVLSVASDALVQYIGDKAVTVSTVVDGKKTIALKLDAANKFLSQSDNGLLAELSLNYNTTTKKVELKSGETVVSDFDASDFVVDGFLDSVAFSTESGKEDTLVFTWNTASGKTTATEIDLAKYIDINTAGNGINIDGTKKISAVADANDKYIEVTANGIASKKAEGSTTQYQVEKDIETAVSDLKDDIAKTITVNGETKTIGGTGADLVITLNGTHIKWSDAADAETIKAKITAIDTAVNGLAGDGLVQDATTKKLSVKVNQNGRGLNDFIMVDSNGLDWKSDTIVFDCGTYGNVPE